MNKNILNKTLTAENAYAYLKILLKNCRCIMALLDKDGFFVLSSQVMLDVMGIPSVNSLVNHNFEDVFRRAFAPKCLNQFKQAITQLNNRQPPKTYHSHMPLLGKPSKAADFPAKSAQLMGFSVVPNCETDKTIKLECLIDFSCTGDPHYYSIELQRVGGGIDSITGIDEGILVTFVDMTDIKRERQLAEASNKVKAKLAKSVEGYEKAQRARKKTDTFIRKSMEGKKVLIVDDVDANLYVAEAMLAPYKLDIELTESGKATIEKIRSGIAYDLIFMDHMMPEMDGITVMQSMRKLGYTAPIVVLSANALVGNHDMFVRKGFDDFIPKPIDPKRLDDILNKFIKEER